MGKISKLNPRRLNNHDSASGMMTEQEEKMLYSSKRHTHEESSHQHNFKRPKNSMTEMEDEDAQNVAEIELSNLNQTSAEEVTEFINRLISKNKISSKNAFDVPLIHLQQMEDFRASLNENTWKRLSSTLENDYKIYGYRVDATHTITYKMVESIARHQATAEQMMAQNMEILPKSTQNKKNSHQNGFLDSFMELEYNENVSKNKLNVDYAKFIEKNQKMLNVSNIESFFGYNPGLQRTKRKFDQQGFKSLLLNNICLQNGCELKLDEHNYHEDDEERPKKEVEDNYSFQGPTQMEINRFEKLLDRVLDQDMNSIVSENEENQNNIFNEIYEVNVNEAKANKDFTDFERLYKIISGEDKIKPLRQIKEKAEPIIEESKQNAAQNFQSVQNEEIIGKVEIQSESFMVKDQNSLQLNENTDKKQIDQPIIEENPQHSSFYNLKQPLKQQIQNAQCIQQENQPIMGSIQESNISLSQLKEEPEHILINKNFQMREVNLSNIDEESQSSRASQAQKPYETGRLRNIEEYIKIKESRKKEKKAKLNIDGLNEDEIAKKLFNRRYTKKKSQSNSKLGDSVKQENGSSHQKTNFNRLKKQDNGMKRSVIFKKSTTEERLFNLTKQRIKENFEQRENAKNNLKQADEEKRRKGKKVSRLFDLPVYQFEQGDINFINPIEQIDPETTQLQFSELYKNYFPSFAFESSQIVQEIRRKKELKEKLLLESQKEAAKKMLEQGGMMEVIEEEQNTLNENQENRVEEQNMLVNSGDSPDISFIHDEFSQAKNQVIIKEAKEKVKKLMLKMLKDAQKKKRVSEAKSKPCKITFKKIYEAYYRQNGYISPALCFLTILHLTNEHNLILEGKQDGNNFKIFVEEQNKICRDLEEDINETKVEIEGSFFSREDSSVSSMRTENEKILRGI